MEEKKTLEELKEQVSQLNREQNETENAYRDLESLGIRDKSILVAWAKEILEREAKIDALKQQIAKLSPQPEIEEKSEEKSLVIVRKSPWQWIMQKVNQVRNAFKENDFGLSNVPGVPTEKLQELRNKRMQKYETMVKSYDEEQKKGWDLDPKEKDKFYEGTKKILTDLQEQDGKLVSNPEKEIGDE